MHRASPLRLSAAARGVLALFAAASLPALASTQGVVISQVYGGGGNTGAPYNADFVELLNASSAPVSIGGWSVQYTSATGTGNFGSFVTPLTGTLQPGQYYLVKLASGTVGANLPTPDATGTGTNMS